MKIDHRNRLGIAGVGVFGVLAIMAANVPSLMARGEGHSTLSAAAEVAQKVVAEDSSEPSPGVPAMRADQPGGAVPDEQPREVGSADPIRAVPSPTAAAPKSLALAAALQESFGGRRARGQGWDQWQAAAPPPRPQDVSPHQGGFVVHLTNGHRLHVTQFEDRGDRVTVTQPRGTYDLSKTLIAAIEPRTIDAAVAPTGRGLR